MTDRLLSLRPRKPNIEKPEVILGKGSVTKPLKLSDRRPVKPIHTSREAVKARIPAKPASVKSKLAGSSGVHSKAATSKPLPRSQSLSTRSASRSELNTSYAELEKLDLQLNCIETSTPLHQTGGGENLLKSLLKPKTSFRELNVSYAEQVKTSLQPKQVEFSAPLSKKFL